MIEAWHLPGFYFYVLPFLTKTQKTPSVGFTLLSSVYAKCHAFVF